MEWIADQGVLDNYCKDWSNPARLGMDTEFVRVGTFHATPCVLQLATPGSVALIDLQQGLDLSALGPFLSAPTTEVVLHACGEDLEILRQLDLPLPAQIFDTQVAAAFAGLGHNLGLAGLCKELLDVDIDKTASRTDWTQRPLTQAQLHYAAEDVTLLHKLAERLDRLVSERGYSDWMQAEMVATSERYSRDDDPSHYYLKMRAAWGYSPRSQWILQRLAAWREAAMRQHNLPRRKVGPDDLLMDLAQNPPLKKNAFERRTERVPGASRAVRDELFTCLQQAREEDVPEGFELISPPLPKSSKALVKAVKGLVNETAQTLDLPAPLLANRAQIEDSVRWLLGEATKPAYLQGWRGDLLQRKISSLETPSQDNQEV